MDHNLQYLPFTSFFSQIFSCNFYILFSKIYLSPAHSHDMILPTVLSELFYITLFIKKRHKFSLYEVHKNLYLKSNLLQKKGQFYESLPAIH